MCLKFKMYLALYILPGKSNHCVCVSRSVVSAMDCSPPGSSVHGLLQARILEWVAILFTRGFSQHRDRTCIYCIASRLFTVWTTNNITISQHLFGTKSTDLLYPHFRKRKMCDEFSHLKLQKPWKSKRKRDKITEKKEHNLDIY